MLCAGFASLTAQTPRAQNHHRSLMPPPSALSLPRPAVLRSVASLSLGWWVLRGSSARTRRFWDSGLLTPPRGTPCFTDCTEQMGRSGCQHCPGAPSPWPWWPTPGWHRGDFGGGVWREGRTRLGGCGEKAQSGLSQTQLGGGAELGKAASGDQLQRRLGSEARCGLGATPQLPSVKWEQPAPSTPRRPVGGESPGLGCGSWVLPSGPQFARMPSGDRPEASGPSPEPGRAPHPGLGEGPGPQGGQA